MVFPYSPEHSEGLVFLYINSGILRDGENDETG
jgi:hypothetical protein